MAVLWQRMADKFPNRWLNAVGDYSLQSIAVDSWRQTLRGIRPHMIAAGLRALDSSGEQWPPSAPAFRQLCIDAEVPSVDQGLNEACSCTRNWRGHTWSHPVIYHAALAIGHWRLMTETRHNLLRPWADAYRRHLARYLDGEDMPTPTPLLIEHKPAKRASAEAAAPHIEAIQRLLRTPTTTEEPNDEQPAD